MAEQHEEPERVTVTASLTTDVGRVTHGMQESIRLIDEILTLDHVNWETTLYVGDVEYHSTKDGPYPNHQHRISVRQSAGVAASWARCDRPWRRCGPAAVPYAPPREVR